jgi:hypothetical protein
LGEEAPAMAAASSAVISMEFSRAGDILLGTVGR